MPERAAPNGPILAWAIEAVGRVDRLARGAMMASGETDRRRQQAILDLKEAVGSLNASTRHVRDSMAEQERLLNQFRAAIRNADELLQLLEHHVRGPLTVVK